jgi:MFS family permease
MKKNDYSRMANKITTTLFATQSLTSAAFIVSGTVSAIVGAQLIGDLAWAGLPAAAQQVGTAAAALAIGAVMNRLGRRWGLTLGLAVGVLGAGLSVGGIMAKSFPLFLAGLLFMGVASAANRLGRFAAAEVHPQRRRGRAISYVVAGGTVGAIVGPLLAGPAGQWALGANMDELAGPFLVTAILLGLASLTVFIWLRPEPRDIGKKIAEMEGETGVHQGITRPLAQILRQPETIIALSAMVCGQMVMAMLMGITSLHMLNYHHDLADISLVISAHTLGMFAFSVFVGRFTDSWGRGPVIMVGAALLVLAGVLAPFSTAVLPLAIALLLLGLGWNFCYVGGSALLTDQLSPAERANTQGTNDLFISLATAAASLSGGLLFATIGFAATGIVGASISLVPLGLTAVWMIQRQRLATI